MNKENMIDTMDDTSSKDNQVLFELPQTCAFPLDDYQSMIKDLILMALPGPSQQIH